MSLGPLAVAMLALALQDPAPTAKPLPDLPDYVFAVLPEDENLDVLYFGGARPTVIRFQVRINGQGYRSSWDGFLARLYKFADADDDGILTEAEANRSGWGQLVANPNGGVGSGPNLAQGDGKTVLEPKGGKVSLDNFIRYVRDGLGHGPLLSQITREADPVHQSSFNQVDLDRDGSLSTAEMASIEGLIRRLDVDEDEVVDQGELDPTRSPFAGVFFLNDGASGESVGGPFVSLATAEARSKAARRLLARYDGAGSATRDERLTLAESGLSFEAFRRADADADGRLDLDEVERHLADPSPGVVLVIRLAKLPGQPATLRLPAPDPLVMSKPDGALMLELDGREVGLAANDSPQDFRQFFERRFQSGDLDKDGAIDRSESQNDGFLPNIFDTVDRNADGKLTRPELNLYLDRSLDLARSRASIHVTDLGRAFFPILDADNDGRLGRRELREAAKRLKPLDVDGDGRLRFDEIPNTFRIVVGRGQTFSNRRRFNMETYDSPPPARPGAKGPGVAWFRTMDRNRDGDVSPREFLGPPEEFRKLDRDGDGLIDEKEAVQGP